MVDQGEGPAPGRKPQGMSFETFVERRIRLAQERGDFGNLPGAGKPLPRTSAEPGWWLRQRLQRADVEREALLPPALRVRKRRERLDRESDGLAQAAEVADLARDYNRDAAEVIRRGPGQGPNIPVRLVDVDSFVAAWRSRRG